MQESGTADGSGTAGGTSSGDDPADTAPTVSAADPSAASEAGAEPADGVTPLHKQQEEQQDLLDAAVGRATAAEAQVEQLQRELAAEQQRRAGRRGSVDDGMLTLLADQEHAAAVAAAQLAELQAVFEKWPLAVALHKRAEKVAAELARLQQLQGTLRAKLGGKEPQGASPRGRCASLHAAALGHQLTRYPVLPLPMQGRRRPRAASIWACCSPA